MDENILWYAQSCVRIIIDGKIIYIDPYKIPKKNQEKADLILITHSHYDHLSIDDINIVADANTIFYIPQDAQNTLSNYKFLNIIKPNETIKIDSITIKSVPAYNVIKTDLHPKANNWMGYIISGSNGTKIYHTGDTEFIPEMQNINADIVMLPLGQTYTMNSVEEAVKLVKTVKAKVAMPMHYGMYEGTNEDKNKFIGLLKDLDKDVEVI